MKKIRIMIAEDEAIVRQGLTLLISAEIDMNVVVVANDGMEAVKYARWARPEVILMDLRMPQKSGLEALEEIRQVDPTIRVIMMTGHSDVKDVLAAVRKGAAGYLLKHCPPAELCQAVRYVYQGEIFLHPTITRKLLQGLNEPPPEPSGDAQLSKRELEVLTLVAQGRSNNDVSNQLGLSPLTVRTHMQNILSKLNMSNRTKATLYALEQGIVELEPHNSQLRS